MNPQLEQYLEDFDRLEGDEYGLGVDKSHDNTVPAVIHNDDDGQVNSPKKPVLDIPLLIGFFVLLLVMTVADWMQWLQMNLLVRIGTTGTSLSIPGVHLLVVAMTVIYILVKKELPQKEMPSKTKTATSFVKKQPNNPPCTTTRNSNNANEEERKKRQHDCRCQLSSVLGSIVAPLLRPTDAIILDGNDDNNYTTIIIRDDPWYSTVEQLAMAHAELLKTMDISMEILKMGTALHLGATESTAERVERALFGRRQRQQQQQLLDSTSTSSTISSIAMPVSFASIRNLVTEAMLGQVKSLLHFAKTTSLLDPSEEETNVMILGPDDVLGGVPLVITLSWLRSSRQQVAALLSYILEELVAPNNGDGIVVTVDDLQHSIQVAKELRLHLRYAIGLGDDGQDSERKVNAETSASDSNSDSLLLQSHLSKLQTHYRKLFIALWAMEDSMTNTTGETDGDKLACESSTKDWWIQVKTLNDDAVASLQDLESALFQEQGPGTANEDEQESNLDLDSRKASNAVQSYTVETNSAQPEVQKCASAKATKTAVFSGKGVVEPQSRRQKKQPSGQKSTSSTAILQKDPISQHFLLGELRTRLQTLSLPEEEHEVKADDEEDASHDNGGPSVATRRQAPVRKTTAIPLFGGATGSLLVGELKNTVQQLGGQNSFGDDDEDDDPHSSVDE